MSLKDELKSVKNSSFTMASASLKNRNDALKAIAENLDSEKNHIFTANQNDLIGAREKNLPLPIISRLKFDSSKLDSSVSGIEDLIDLEDPLSKNLLKRELDEGLLLEKTTCPIGVIGVIFESRPDALVQIATLCIKTGNCVIMKGGREASNTNRKLFDIIYKSGIDSGLPRNFALLIEDRSSIDEMLRYDDFVDLIIPRGSNEFVAHIMSNSRIPVMGHADGICHIYADETANIEKSVNIISDSKTQYPAACNAVETLLVHRKISETLLSALAARSGKKIKYRCDESALPFVECEKIDEEDFKKEYLDTVLNVKVVEDIDEAIEHINRYGSHHTDCIITENQTSADKFTSLVDSAGVYHNCSTRFADGYRYGFGAEVGISTGKLHARGPVGPDGLVTYKYTLKGDGHIVEDYASGKSTFRHRDLK